MKVSIRTKEFFPTVGKIRFEGVESRNPLTFRYYDENKIVSAKAMKEHLRFSMAYWHTLCGTGGDPFGPGRKEFPWETSTNLMQRNHARMDSAFEFMTKSGKQLIYEQLIDQFI